MTVQVSAVVSVYNAERFMYRRLENLVGQTLYRQGGLEIIVVDSASPQDEAAIVRNFHSQYERIKYLRTAGRETVYQAWNRGCELAEGEFFINANSDDLFLENGLETLADSLKKHSTCDAVYGDWYFLSEEELRNRVSPVAEQLYCYPDFHSPLLFYTQPTSHALMIRRKKLIETGLFNPQFEVFGDRDWVFRLAVQGGRVFHLSCPVGIYCRRPDSLERSRNEVGQREFNTLLQHYSRPENICRLYGEDPSVVADKQKLSRCYARTGELGIYFAVASDIETERDRLPQQAALFLRRALVLDFGNFSAANNLAVIAALAGQPDFAEKTLKAGFVGSDSEAEYLEHNLRLLRRGARRLSEFRWYLSPGNEIAGMMGSRKVV